MQRRQKILIIMIVILILLGLLFGVTHLLRGKPNPNGIDPGEASQTTGNGVTITNFKNYSSWIDSSKRGDIESTIYSRVTQSNKLSPNHYDAVIRKDSLHTTYSSYNDGDNTAQVPSVTFLVDIPKASESYLVSFSGGTGYPYNILYVLCPKTNQLIYGDFGCKDPVQ